MLVLRVLGVVLVASIAVFPAVAAAAVVSPVAGEVRIGTGHGFHSINAPTEVAAGAQIMVGPKGSASIAYSDTCVVPAAPAAITVVESGTPCTSFAQPSYFGFAQGAEYGIGPGADTMGFTPKVDAPESDDGDDQERRRKAAARLPSPSPSPSPPAVEQPPWDHSLLIVGGVVLGAGALALLLGGGDSPASP